MKQCYIKDLIDSLLDSRLLLTVLFSGYLFSIEATGKPNQFEFNASPSYGFIENRGQILDQHGALNSEVQYMIPLEGMNVHLRKEGFSYELYEYHEVNNDENIQDIVLSEIAELPESIQEGIEITSNYQRNSHRIDINFTGMNPDAEIIALNPADDYMNYYTYRTPDSGVTNVRHYEMVMYTDIYPDIDIIFKVDSSGLKYDFIVHPGGTPGDIIMQYKGALDISLTDDGAIALLTSLGELQETIPKSYVKENGSKKLVEVTYVLESNEVHFNINGSYRNKKLIIDPVPNLLWGTYYPAKGSVSGINHVAYLLRGFNGLKVKDDYIIIAFETKGNYTLATSGAYQTTRTGITDGFISKFKNTGTLEWTTYYGGEGGESINGVDVSINDQIFIAGTTTSDSNITSSGGVYKSVKSGYSESFIAKLDSSGYRIWSSYLGTVTVTDIYLKDAYNILITGAAHFNPNLSTPGAHQENKYGSIDGFVAKFTTSGQLTWATYYGGNKIDYVNGIATDKSGNIFITGFASSSNHIATSGAFRESCTQGAVCGFIAKFDSQGNRQWGSYLGMDKSTWGKQIATDNQDNVYVTGKTKSDSGIATTGAFQEQIGDISNEYYDAFLIKFDNQGAQIWGTYFGGAYEDTGIDLVTDSTNNVYITGLTSSFGAGGSGTFNVILAKFTPQGALQWSKYFGGNNNDAGYSIGLDNDENVYLWGYTSSMENIASPGAHFPEPADAFIAKFSQYPLNADAGPDIIQCIHATMGDTIGGDPTSKGQSVPLTYLWEPSHGLSDPSIPNPVAKPDTTTRYRITVTDNMGVKRTDSVLVTVTPPAELQYSTTPLTCGNVLFQAELINPDSGSITWHIPGIADTASDSFMTTFPEPGKYLYSLSLKEVGCDTTLYDTLTVPGFIRFTTDQSPETCRYTPYTLAPLAMDTTGPVTWEVNGYSFSGSTKIHADNDTVLILKGSDGTGCSQTDTVYLQVHNLPEPDTENGTFCLNETPVLSTQHTDYDITWRNAFGQIISTIPEVTFNTGGTYSITYTNRDAPICEVTDTISVSIASEPTHNLTDEVLCVTDILQKVSPIPSNWSEWRHLQLGTTLSTVPTLEYASPYPGYIMLEAGEIVNGRTCIYRDTFHLSIGGIQDTGYIPPPAVCINEVYALPEGIFNEVVWSGPGISNNTWRPWKAGAGVHEITYKFTDPQSSCVIERTFHSEVYDVPELTLTAEPDSGESPLIVTVRGESTVNTYDPVIEIYSDTGFHKTIYSGQAEITHRFNEPGTYTIMYSATDPDTGCRDTVRKDSFILVTPRITLLRDTEPVGADVFPNPAGDELYIHSKVVLESVKLTTLTGRIVRSKIPETEKVRVIRADLPAGIYILHLRYKDQTEERVKVVFR